MENRRIALFLIFIFLASITHLDYFSENEKLEMEMEEKTVSQSSSSNSNHDVGNFSLGGYYIIKLKFYISWTCVQNFFFINNIFERNISLKKNIGEFRISFSHPNFVLNNLTINF